MSMSSCTLCSKYLFKWPTITSSTPSQKQVELGRPIESKRCPLKAFDSYCSFPDYLINEEKLRARLASMFGMSECELRYTWQQGEYLVFNVPMPSLTDVRTPMTWEIKKLTSRTIVPAGQSQTVKYTDA